MKETGWTIVKNRYKKVQSNSTNQQQCSRGPSLLQTELTPDRNNRALGTFNHRTRVTVKLSIEALEDPKEAILNAMQEFFEEFTNANDAGAILPWKRSNFGKGKIDKSLLFPAEFSNLRTYVPRLFAGKKDVRMTIYPNLWLGHSISFQELRKMMQPWLSNESHGFYQNMLQTESSSEIGFFLYLCREMDTGALADEMKEMFVFKVGLRWKTINNGKQNLPVK